MNEIQKQVSRIGKLLSIGFSTSKTLAAHVVIYKALNMDKELALLCMKELAIRRELGQDFDYESYIEEELSKFPKMRGTNLPDIGRRIISSQNFKFIKEK